MKIEKQMYIDLLKRSILDIIYEPEVHEDWGQQVGGGYINVHGTFVLSREEAILQGLYWPKRGLSMIGYRRMENIQECVENIFRDGIEGDFIETGVWRGGACIFMAGLNKIYNQNRKIYVADSFCGLPKPQEEYEADKGDNNHEFDFLRVDIEEVKNNFRRYRLLNNNVVFLKGFFEDTLPTAPVEKLSILRLDGDMYSSTIQALENLYPKLSVGGYVIVDDYALSGCREAIYDYRDEHDICDKMEKIDCMSVFWRKTRQ